MSTQAQINANRANSQHSTGPKTEAGKSKSSHNAVKSALTGRTILLPTDEAPAYQRLVQSLIDQHRPVTYREQLLVQSLADIDWRLDRIPCIVSGLMGIARDEFNELHPYHTTNVVEASAYLRFERELKNLSIQETRLRRMRHQDLAELLELQAERQKKEEEQAKTTPQPQPQSQPQPKEQSATASPSPEIGFEFETAPEAAKAAA